MAATFIPALVIKHNNDVYLTPDLVVGVTMAIPTPGAGGVIDGDYWAVPIDDNIMSGWDFVPTTPTSTTPPTANSFHVFRLTNRFGYDVWYVRGTTTLDGASPALPGYIQASQDAECCEETPRTLPMTTPRQTACQLMCEWNADGLYFAMFSLPSLTGATPKYFPYGWFNGVALDAASAAGYATKSALLSFLNSGSWVTVGTWSYVDADQTVLQVVQADGPGTDTLCASIIAYTQSA